MERIAIVADIHANIHALKVFLNHIDNECKVSKILNVGDFLQIGPNPVEVFDIVMKDQRFINIMGNNEYALFDRKLMEFAKDEVLHQEWVINELGKERMKALEKLPFKKIINIGNKKILMLHSRLNSIIDFPLLYEKKSLEEFIEDYNEPVDYVLIGHTHLPLYVTNWSKKNILNPGVFGCGGDGIVKFIIMEVEDETININFKQLKYNKQKVIEDFRKNAVPYGEKFIEIFY
jgi:predicted phosphodiesterase